MNCCRGEVCHDCCFKLVSSNLDNKNTNIKCTECGTTIDVAEQFQQIEDRALLDWYNTVVSQNNPNLTNCPLCDNQVEIDDNSYCQRCSNCYTLFCTECHEYWHANHECEPLCDDDRDENFKRCPSCKYWVVHESGCLAMTCANCKMQFCWSCLKRKAEIDIYGYSHPCDGTFRYHNDT
jgi:E3 ubiquitin-protein ligase RNF144